MKYIDKARRAFKKLRASVKDHPAPCFRKLVLDKAQDLSEHHFRAGHELDLSERFYTYVLLDKSKRGVYKYHICDLDLCFDYEPFYIGKGHGDRLNHHVKNALNGKDNSHKGKRIRKIDTAGKKVRAVKMSADSIESIAFAQELLLIKHIGQRNTKTGPLTNVSIGGDGLAGIPKSAEHKANLSGPKSESHKQALRAARKNQQLTTSQLDGLLRAAQRPKTREHKNAISAALKGTAKSDEHKMAISKARKGAVLSDAGRASMREKVWDKNTGTTRTKATRLRMSKAALGHEVSKETRQKISAAHKGKTLSATHIAALREAHSKPHPKVKCPKCGVEGGARGMKRYHFDNCKVRPHGKKR